MTNQFKPSYIWPNPAIPFRIFYESSRGRILIIENLTHNYEWLRMYGDRLKKNDHFLVLVGSYHGPDQIKEAHEMFLHLNLDKSKFSMLFNSSEDKANFEQYGFFGVIANQNAWLDESLVMRPLALAKLYDAIYVGRRIAVKRHMLASKVSRLALVAGNSYQTGEPAPVPDHEYLNDAPLKPEEVCEKINQAHVGLILSAREGANFASSEYLLCGIPVVSTHSEGGRHIWYNEFNSIVVPADPEAVADAVARLKSLRRDPNVIRSLHIQQAEKYRAEFVRLLGKTLKTIGDAETSPGDLFRASFFHKLRKSYRPDFESIFSNHAVG